MRHRLVTAGVVLVLLLTWLSISGCAAFRLMGEANSLATSATNKIAETEREAKRIALEGRQAMERLAALHADLGNLVRLGHQALQEANQARAKATAAAEEIAGWGKALLAGGAALLTGGGGIGLALQRKIKQAQLQARQLAEQRDRLAETEPELARQELQRIHEQEARA